ncbi:hypothetical protein [Nocardioides marmorisolisilvae]|uniref:Fibronectin type III domain-containing protein n=1 Tax=Nocardioides marmorisolisilvae TaxID=1542737 RepID=A0A3N0DSF6_9ACTN|nr:hypothetical protein [Nocardioides marmorisolisilvae]RNL78303.1 hypothetical protein EFL95_04125 [Nocardioides marmorisolisilvae]
MRKTLVTVLAGLTVAAVLVQPAPVLAATAISAPGVWVSGAGASQVTWAWSAVGGATSYKVSFSRYASMAHASSTTTTSRIFKHAGLTSGHTYFVAVRAVVGGATSSRSKIVPGLAGAVPQPKGTAVPAGAAVDWRWNPYAGAAKYLVQQASSPTFQVGLQTHVVSRRTIRLAVTRGNYGYLRVKPLSSSGKAISSTWSLIGSCFVPSTGPLIGPT